MIKVKGGIYDSSGGGERFKLVIENRGTSQEYKPGFIEELEQYATALADAKKSTEQLEKEAEKITFNVSKSIDASRSTLDKQLDEISQSLTRKANEEDRLFKSQSKLRINQES
ncbi:hypothetical protein [Endozoicomonas ascidiicola]|uniref:hypothetical protein n=1 Tax=Endozoicomonas ascidiicola TaxID=1698521 RepID=UPI0008330624|nr:hypothetical protein [Endozoicomonas ascidiicola]